MTAADESLAGPARHAREFLGVAAAPYLAFIEGGVDGDLGLWSEARWRPSLCDCPAEDRLANHSVGSVDFAKGDLDGAGSCGCKERRAPAAPAWVDIYFSAGKRHNWDRIGLDLDPDEDPATRAGAYRSCDDGNERSCEIWRVRWDFSSGMSTAKAEKVIGREDFGVTDAAPIGLTRPAVSPDGTFLAYAWREWGSTNTFSEAGSDFAVRVAEIGGPRSADNEVAWPLPWGGGVGWPAWVGDHALAVGNEMALLAGKPCPLGCVVDGKRSRTWEPFNASFKTVQMVLLEDTAFGKEALPGWTWPVFGPGVRYASLAFVPNSAESEAIRGMRVGTDPHAHLDALYEGESRGLRIASFGNHHDESDGEAATTVVYDPMVYDPFGEAAESFRKPSETYEGTSESEAGLHHPTWNVTGDMVQCSHQEWQVRVTDFVTRRGLYGFVWSADEGQWVPWGDDGQGRLFPNDGWSESYSSQWWWDGLPDTLYSMSEGLPASFPDAVEAAGQKADERCSMYVWKYGAFCGSDDYVVAQLACVNPAWGRAQFTDQIAGAEDPDKAGKDIEHLAQVASRVVLIRLSDGFHWDLTSLVEAALGDTPLLPITVFGIYPTCGASHGALPFG